MDETGVILGELDTVKVLIARGDKEQRRGRAIKRVIIKAIHLSLYSLVRLCAPRG